MAERDAGWDMHLVTFQEMLWYDGAYDHYKYFTCGLTYPPKHPDLYENFRNGHHTVPRCKKQSAFNNVSTDMALE